MHPMQLFFTYKIVRLPVQLQGHTTIIWVLFHNINTVLNGCNIDGQI